VRTCQTCGASLEGRRSTAKFCNDLHRAEFKRGKRAPVLAEVVELAPAAEDDRPVELITLEAVAAELQFSLQSPATPPSAKAGLAREYRATLAEIEAKRPKAKDGIDEIAERRARRSS
jgi:hypothetical protein